MSDRKPGDQRTLWCQSPLTLTHQVQCTHSLSNPENISVCLSVCLSVRLAVSLSVAMMSPSKALQSRLAAWVSGKTWRPNQRNTGPHAVPSDGLRVLTIADNPEAIPSHKASFAATLYISSKSNTQPTGRVDFCPQAKSMPEAAGNVLICW